MHVEQIDKFLAFKREVRHRMNWREAARMSFSELKQKDVINICDGRKMGRPIDLILNERACVEAIVVPSCDGGLIGLIKPNRDGITIPWRNVRQIGDDVILVEVEPAGVQ